VALVKRCFKCGTDKPLDQFYEHKMMGDGHLGKCKECTKQDVSKHRADNLDKVRAYDRRRAKLPERRAKSELVSKAWRARGPAARSAHSMVGHALRDGRLRRGKCEVCGSLRAHAHHDDYLKPLDVRWLCAEHHKAWHIKHGPGANPDAHVPDRRKFKKAA
jgi:hypothetical protein